MKVIYLDNAATTVVAPEVIQAMSPYWTTHFGNASSRFHAYGWAAEEAVVESRQKIAKCIGAFADEVVFTSGSSEALQLLMMGWFGCGGQELLTGATEHAVVLDLAAWASSHHKKVTILPVDRQGNIPQDTILPGNPDLVLLMWGNNEIGTCHEIVFWVNKIKNQFPGCWVGCDATQAVGKWPIHFHQSGLDCLVGSGHKFHGPKGVGFLCVRRGLEFNPWGKSHRQERGRRAGTVAVPLVVGMAEAITLSSEVDKICELRNFLEKTIRQEIPNSWVNGNIDHRLPHISSITFPGIDGERLFQRLTQIAVSNGSACTSAEVLPSHVLRAIGLRDEEAESTVRFSLSRYTTHEEIVQAVNHVVQVVKRL